jgi:hypothetical protein
MFIFIMGFLFIVSSCGNKQNTPRKPKKNNSTGERGASKPSLKHSCYKSGIIVPEYEICFKEKDEYHLSRIDLPSREILEEGFWIQKSAREVRLTKFGTTYFYHVEISSASATEKKHCFSYLLKNFPNYIQNQIYKENPFGDKLKPDFPIGFCKNL